MKSYKVGCKNSFNFAYQCRLVKLPYSSSPLERIEGEAIKRAKLNDIDFAHIKEYMLKFSKIVMLITGIVVAVLCMTILL